MKEILITILVIAIMPAGLCAQEVVRDDQESTAVSVTENESTYRHRFQKAFAEVVAAAKDNFKGVYKEKKYVNKDKALHQLTVQFPDAYTETFYKMLYKNNVSDAPTVFHLVQVDYNTDKDNSSLAAYGIRENDEDKMKARYMGLVDELLAVKNENIGNGDWQVIDTDKFPFAMVSTNDNMPVITVAIAVDYTLGVQLQFYTQQK
ncbi:MAG: hypothetical protein GXO86_03175 [Chlorobi bacterium]|nr:hypothetical protein [Chlorobiota bacterium]